MTDEDEERARRRDAHKRTHATIQRLAVVIALVALIAVGALALYAGTAHGNGGNNNTSSGQNQNGVHSLVLAGDTPPAATPTDTPAPTDTPIPPTPTATPLPVVTVSFTCADVEKYADGTLGVIDLCISTSPAEPGASVSINARDCHNSTNAGIAATLDANGTRTLSAGSLGTTTCAAPFMLTLSVGQVINVPYTMQGSTTVTVQAA